MKRQENFERLSFKKTTPPAQRPTAPFVGRLDIDLLPGARQRERARVFALIAGGQANSRREIAARLRLRSTPTSQLVNELIARGLALEAVGAAKGRGRPAGTLVVNARAVRHAGADRQPIAGRQRRRYHGPGDCRGNRRCRHRQRQCADGDDAAHDGPSPRRASAGGGHPYRHRLVDCRHRRSGHAPLAALVALAAHSHLPLADCLGPEAGRVEIVRNLDAELHARLDDTDRGESMLLVHWGYGIGLAGALSGQQVDRSSGFLGKSGIGACAPLARGAAAAASLAVLSRRPRSGRCCPSCVAIGRTSPPTRTPLPCRRASAICCRSPASPRPWRSWRRRWAISAG